MGFCLFGNVVVGRQVCVVDPQNNGSHVALGGSGNDHLLGSRLNVTGGQLLGHEQQLLLLAWRGRGQWICSHPRLHGFRCVPSVERWAAAESKPSHAVEALSVFLGIPKSDPATAPVHELVFDWFIRYG